MQQTYNSINEYINNKLKVEKDLILIGYSLGGFWADLFAQKYNLKCILRNPMIFPSITLKKYLIKNFITESDIEEYEIFENLFKNSKIRKTIILDKCIKNLGPSVFFDRDSEIIIINEMNDDIKKFVEIISIKIQEYFIHLPL